MAKFSYNCLLNKCGSSYFAGEEMQKNYHTRCKDGIMLYLQNNADLSFSAYDIHEYMQTEGVQVNLTTIYRNLDKMTDSGTVMKFKTSDGEGYRYQYVKPHRNCQEHLHMQCRECGRIYHLECGFMDELSRHLYSHHGFSLECGGSILIGLCAECKEAEWRLE